MQFGNLTPLYCYLTSGEGVHSDALHAFETALREAGIADQNLVSVSSIFPPHCQLIDREIGQKYLSPGDIRFCVKAELRDHEPNHILGASVGLAIPKDPEHHGYLSEYERFGWSAKQLGDHAEDKAAEFLATTMDIPFDPNMNWDEKKQRFILDGKIVRTENMTRIATGDSSGKTTCVVAFAIFLFKSDIARFNANHPETEWVLS